MDETTNRMRRAVMSTAWSSVNKNKEDTMSYTKKTLRDYVGDEALNHRAEYRKALVKELESRGYDITKYVSYSNRVLELVVLGKWEGEKQNW